jgi:hypothetical protein
MSNKQFDLRHVCQYIEKLEEVEVFHQLIGQLVDHSLLFDEEYHDHR